MTEPGASTPICQLIEKWRKPSVVEHGHGFAFPDGQTCAKCEEEKRLQQGDPIRRQCADELEAVGAVADPQPRHPIAAFLKRLPDLPSPEVHLEEDGEIGFDWSAGARCVLSVSLGTEGRVGWAALIGDWKGYGATELDGDWSALNEAFAKFSAVEGGAVADPARPQLEWEDQDEEGDYVVHLRGIPKTSVSAHGQTRELALHRLGDAMCIMFEDGCEDCAKSSPALRALRSAVQQFKAAKTGSLDQLRKHESAIIQTACAYIASLPQPVEEKEDQ